MRFGESSRVVKGGTTTIIVWPHRMGAIIRNAVILQQLSWMPPNRTNCLCLRPLVNLAGSALLAHAQHRLAQAAHLGPHRLPCLLQPLHQLMLHALQAQGI